MTTYLYETIPAKPRGKVTHYEIRQSMKDDALKTHPDTGAPIRRVVTGGYGVLTAGKGSPAPSSHSCQSGGCCC